MYAYAATINDDKPIQADHERHTVMQRAERFAICILTEEIPCVYTDNLCAVTNRETGDQKNNER